MTNSTQSRRFIVATPFRSVCDDHARVLAKHGLLRGYFLGTRRGTTGIPSELTHLNPLFGLWMMGTRMIFSTYQAEWLRTAMHPLYDRWVRRHLRPGDCIISSYGYANRCFQWARKHGGATLVDGGNSHPENFWKLISEENKRWDRNYPPYPPHWYHRGMRMLPDMDYILSPSMYVTRSFTDRGFPEKNILRLPYPVDLSIFNAKREKQIPNEPLKVVCTGSVSVRKGIPYLLEAMRIIRTKRDATLLLTRQVESGMDPILKRYEDIPIEWAPPVPQDQLASRLKEAHVFALLSLEEGLVRTALEAMACGLPVVLTSNTGTSDFIQPGTNGEIVPIRDPQAAAEAILRCHDRVKTQGYPAVCDLQKELSFETFEARFLAHLKHLNFI